MGDSGGGFAIEMDNTWYLRGVVSFGYTTKRSVEEDPTCIATVPSLYEDIAKKAKWIRKWAFDG
jgi:secreted trypsin-like serine protease